ncbi:helix-turn-helix domain-containing protein [Vibrio fluvialis]
MFHETNNRIDCQTLEKLCVYLECEVGDPLQLKKDKR